MTTIEALEDRVNALEASILQMQGNLMPVTETAEMANAKVDRITPYTDSKTAYIGDTEVIFENVPIGNMTVFGLPEYNIDRQSDRVTITFNAVDEVTTVSISIQ